MLRTFYRRAIGVVRRWPARCGLICAAIQLVYGCVLFFVVPGDNGYDGYMYDSVVSIMAIMGVTIRWREGQCDEHAYAVAAYIVPPFSYVCGLAFAFLSMLQSGVNIGLAALPFYVGWAYPLSASFEPFRSLTGVGCAVGSSGLMICLMGVCVFALRILYRQRTGKETVPIMSREVTAQKA